ncbi:hypothetical protein [Actinomycetospora sp. NBRC 106378]|uniref:hypothetical protein n=1 Tax=Actinomycetospora sp. NBRC 106378 TaxID=3032208 RepID=UPI0024A4A131|nr:hypothetical protein [Actinomycetospora sp. NBRC 106378]GLZ52748.1 hypothetical protein Acsp07_23650 [Actinomycetospora sp. NBRC 106378]
MTTQIARPASTLPTPGLVGDLVGPVVRALGLAPSRRTSGRPGRTHVEVRGIATPGQAGARRDLVEELRAVPGVSGAVVNAVLGRVVVDHTPDVELARLVAVVEEVERRHGLHRAPADTGGHHPADVTPWSRQVLALGVDLAGLGLAGVERWLGLVPLTRAVPPLLTGTLSLVDAVPSSRSAAERTAGGATTESWFSLGSASLQALGRGPVGLVVDACYRAIRADEAAARTSAWTAWDTRAPLTAHAAEPVDAPSRPGALPRGPVDVVGDVSGATALAAFGTVAALVPERAAAVLLSGVPKAARWGREAYAAAAHRAVSDLGVVSIDPQALRRADRVDVVVLGRTLADRLGAAASEVGRLVVVDDAATAGAVARLQAAGHGVVLVSADDTEGLAAADVGIGVGPDVPWSAALRCADADQARALLLAVAGARAASWRAALLALTGSAVGAPIALGTSLVGLTGRTNAPVTLAALAALVVNTWAGRRSAR